MTSTLVSSQPRPPVKVFGEPQLHTDGDVLALAFTPDGALLSVEEPGVLRRWNASDARQLDWLALSDLETLWAFSRDARVLASGSDDLTLWDASSGHVLTALQQPSWVTALDFPADSGFVASGHDDGVVRYWDAAGHHLIHELRRHKRPISALAFSPDGKTLAASAEDKLVSLWDVASGKELGVLSGHTDRVPALAWHPSGDFLVSAGWDTSARVWDVRTREPVILLNMHAGQATALAFSPDGKRLATADANCIIHVWDFEKKRILYQLKGPQGEVRFLAFSPDNQRLAASGDRMLYIWDAASGQPVAGAGPRPIVRTSVAVSPDGAQLATNGGGGDARVWSIPTGQTLWPIAEKHPVHGLAFSSDGKWLAAALESHVRLFDAATGRPRMELLGPEEPITRVAFSRDSKLLASASTTGLGVWIWRVEDGEPILLIPDALDGCAVETLSFDPRGRFLAVGGIDHMATGGSTGAISIWDLEERCEITVFLGGTLTVAHHPSAPRLASGALDGAVCVWDLEGKDILSASIGHEGAVTAVAWRPDGQLLASGGEDRTLRFWDPLGEEISLIEVDSQITAFQFAPDGKTIFCSHANTVCSQIAVP